MWLSAVANKAYNINMPAGTRGGAALDYGRTRQKNVSQPNSHNQPRASAYAPTEFWQNRGRFVSRYGDSVELDNRLRGEGGDKKSIVEEINKSRECLTCKNRKYMDRSDDPSVSYQTPTKLNSSTAAAAVAAHENEHVVNERNKAEKEGREIVSQTVTIKYDICPECGKSYVAGGLTRTRSRGKRESGEAEDAARTQEGSGQDSRNI